MKIVKVKRQYVRQQKQLDLVRGKPRPKNGTKQQLAIWMKANPTPSEALFASTWNTTTHHKLDEQKLVAGFIVDFLVRKPKRLVIEIDGSVHDATQDYDSQRDAILRVNGFNVIRVTNAEVMSDPVGTVMKVLTYMEGCVKLKGDNQAPLMPLAGERYKRKK